MKKYPFQSISFFNRISRLLPKLFTSEMGIFSFFSREEDDEDEYEEEQTQEAGEEGHRGGIGQAEVVAVFRVALHLQIFQLDNSGADNRAKERIE